MSPDVGIRPARGQDLEAITRLYNHYVIASPATFDITPFSPETRRPWFEHYAEQGRHRLLVAESAGAIVGYTCSSTFRPKAAYETSIETSVYLAPEATGRGLGTRLYEALFAALAGEDIHRAYAGITLPNPASLALHRRFGFREVGRHEEVGRKFGRYWSVQWMEKPMP